MLKTKLKGFDYDCYNSTWLRCSCWIRATHGAPLKAIRVGCSCKTVWWRGGHSQRQQKRLSLLLQNILWHKETPPLPFHPPRVSVRWILRRGGLHKACRVAVLLFSLYNDLSGTSCRDSAGNMRFGREVYHLLLWIVAALLVYPQVTGNILHLFHVSYAV